MQKKHSENTINLRSSWGIDLMVMVVSWYLFASWRSRLASARVSTWALLICDCKLESLLERSGRVLVDAYCKEPIKPLKRPRSFSLIGSSGEFYDWLQLVLGKFYECNWIDWGWCWNWILIYFNTGESKRSHFLGSKRVLFLQKFDYMLKLLISSAYAIINVDA